MLLLGKCLVHQSAHQGIVDGIPNVPDQKKGRQNDGIYVQNVCVVTGNIGAHESKGHAAAGVTQAIADQMLCGQSVADRFLSHCHFSFLLSGICPNLQEYITKV